MAFYGNYSRSFVPNASDATTGQAFDPEEGRSYELGVKLDLPQGIGASLALFDIEKENVVVSNNNVSEAAGKVGSRGVELASASTGNCSAATPTPIRKSSMTQPTKVTSWSTPHATSPASTSPITWICHSNSVSGDWGGGARYVGERAGDNANTFWLDSYTVADAFISWDSQLLGDKTRLQLNVRNLFDERYYPSSGGNLRVAVGEPREVRLSASVEF